jgi:enoyl-CoA hydratase
MSQVLLERTEPHITVLTLNRPERLNALTFGLVADIHDALDEVAADPECRVVVLTGAGRGFCSGLDLKDTGTPPAPGTHRHAPVGVGGQEFIANLPVHMRATPQVIVAAVNGVAYGGGLSLAMAADIRIAAASATFCSAFIRTGLTGTDIGISYLLPKLIGVSRAFDMILTGRSVDAAEAERMGIVSRVVPEGAALAAALETARTIASYSRSGLLMTKEVLWANVDVDSMSAAIALENRNQMLAARSPEFQEYMTAFKEKRNADFG